MQIVELNNKVSELSGQIDTLSQHFSHQLSQQTNAIVAALSNRPQTLNGVDGTPPLKRKSTVCGFSTLNQVISRNSQLSTTTNRLATGDVSSMEISGDSLPTVFSVVDLTNSENTGSDDFVSINDCTDVNDDTERNTHTIVPPHTWAQKVSNQRTTIGNQQPASNNHDQVRSSSEIVKGGANAGATNGIAEKSPKPTPIQLGLPTHGSYASIIAGLNREFGDSNFRWHQLRHTASSRIFASDTATKDAIMKWLTTQDVEFNTYCEKNQKRKSFLLRGMPRHDDVLNMQCIASTHTVLCI